MISSVRVLQLTFVKVSQLNNDNQFVSRPREEHRDAAEESDAELQPLLLDSD